MMGRRRLATCLLAFLLGGVWACADLSGLGGLAQRSAPSEAGGASQVDDAGEVVDAPGVDDAGSAGEGVAIEAATEGAEVGTMGDPDSAGAADAPVDAAAVCRAQCSGCCDGAGMCHGGRSLATCGSGGGACRDCSSESKVCDTAGACAAASPQEAGPPPACVVTKCTNMCPTLPLLEAPCCKPDQTCGCGAVLGILLCN